MNDFFVPWIRPGFNDAHFMRVFTVLNGRPKLLGQVRQS